MSLVIYSVHRICVFLAHCYQLIALLVEITPLLQTVQGNLGVCFFGGPGLICTSPLWMIIKSKMLFTFGFRTICVECLPKFL